MMHFLPKDVERRPKDLAYWRDLALGAVGAVCILGCLGHALDWTTTHKSVGAGIAAAFLAAYCLIALVIPKRLKHVFLSLIAIIAWGILGAVSNATAIGFIVVIPCAILAGVLLRWKRDLLQ
jgi:hypothetical protein